MFGQFDFRTLMWSRFQKKILWNLQSHFTTIVCTMSRKYLGNAISKPPCPLPCGLALKTLWNPQVSFWQNHQHSVLQNGPEYFLSRQEMRQVQTWYSKIAGWDFLPPERALYQKLETGGDPTLKNVTCLITMISKLCFLEHVGLHQTNS